MLTDTFPILSTMMMIGLLALPAWLIWRFVSGVFSGYFGKTSWICRSCGTLATPITITKGSLVLEILLWLCMILPGLIYSLWRLTSRYRACGACQSADLIPVHTPAGQALKAQYAKKEGLP